MFPFLAHRIRAARFSANCFPRDTASDKVSISRSEALPSAHRLTCCAGRNRSNRPVLFFCSVSTYLVLRRHAPQACVLSHRAPPPYPLRGLLFLCSLRPWRFIRCVPLIDVSRCAEALRRLQPQRPTYGHDPRVIRAYAFSARNQLRKRGWVNACSVCDLIGAIRTEFQRVEEPE